MKISLAIAPENALPSAFVVYRDKLEASMARAAHLGYDGVELALLSADQVHPASIRAALDAHGLGLPVISTGQVYADARLWFTHPDREIRYHAAERVISLIDLAAQLGAAMVNIGRVRGHIHPDETLQTAQGRFLEGMGRCADHARGAGVELILEPVNRYEINYINSVPQALEALAKLGRPNVKVMPDVFHMNIEDASIIGSLAMAGDRLGYIHLADSNRHAPGQGHLDFPAILETLQRMGYDGWVGVEILPYPDPDTAARQAIDYLRRFIPPAAR